MSAERRNALINTTLERAAEHLGDIAPLVAKRFCKQFPDAESKLDTLWPGGRDQLEGQMVETALYCLMNWTDYPGEIEVLLWGTVPHHAQTLDVRPDWFSGFLTATAEVIAETIPADNAEERAVWEEMVTDLLRVIAQSAV